MMITISQLFFRIPSFELDLKVKEGKSVETSNGDYFTKTFRGIRLYHQDLTCTTLGWTSGIWGTNNWTKELSIGSGGEA